MSKTFFVSSAEPVLEAFDETVRSLASYRAACQSLKDDLGSDRRLYEVVSTNGRRISSVTGEKPGDAWKRHPKGGWTPYRNQMKDPVLLDRWVSLKCRYTNLPGMPSETLGLSGVPFLGRTYSAGWRLIGGDVWATWGCDRSALGDHVDEQVWRQAKASEYHLALEAEAEITGGAK